MAELLPCPFCGEKLVQDKFGNWEHIANDCILSWLDSEYGKVFFGNCEEYIRAWNTRTPTADVVEVVRCKDCAVPHNQWTGCPKLNGLVTPPDFYCSYGERKLKK